MKFSLLITLSAFALLSTSMVSAEDQKLRGPVLAATPDGNISPTGQRHGRSSSRAVPKFFPTDMTEDQIANFKEDASQKRQRNRDAKRATNDPDRTQAQEDAERARKTRQSESRDDPSVDPYSNKKGNAEEYGRKRETNRIANCERNGEGCGYSGVNSMCYNDCLDNRSSSRAEVCAQTCRYIGAVCYDDCRNEGSTVARCLDDCGKNIDGNTGRAADRVDCAQDCADDNRVGSSGYKRCMDRNCSDDGDTRRGAVRNNVCEENCGDDFNKNSNKYDRCMDNCSDDTADQ